MKSFTNYGYWEFETDEWWASYSEAHLEFYNDDYGSTISFIS